MVICFFREHFFQRNGFQKSSLKNSESHLMCWTWELRWAFPWAAQKENRAVEERRALKQWDGFVLALFATFWTQHTSVLLSLVGTSWKIIARWGRAKKTWEWNLQTCSVCNSALLLCDFINVFLWRGWLLSYLYYISHMAENPKEGSLKEL